MLSAAQIFQKPPECRQVRFHRCARGASAVGWLRRTVLWAFWLEEGKTFWGGGWENMPVRGSEIKIKRIAKLWEIKGLCDPWKVLYQQRPRTKNTGWCPKPGVPSMSVSTSSDSSVGQHWSVPLPLCHSAPGGSVSLGCCNKMSQAGWCTPELLKLGLTTPYLAWPPLVMMGRHCCLMLITYHVCVLPQCVSSRLLTPEDAASDSVDQVVFWISGFFSFSFFFPGKEKQLL